MTPLVEQRLVSEDNRTRVTDLEMLRRIYHHRPHRVEMRCAIIAISSFLFLRQPAGASEVRYRFWLRRMLQVVPQHIQSVLAPLVSLYSHSSDLPVPLGFTVKTKCRSGSDSCDRSPPLFLCATLWFSRDRPPPPAGARPSRCFTFSSDAL